MRIDSAALLGMGIDLSKPGTAAGSLSVLCEGSVAEPLDLYFGGGLIYHYMPRYKINTVSNVHNLNITLWPGAQSFIDLTATWGSYGRVKLVDQGFVLSVKVFESREHYLQGEGLSELKSIRHNIVQAGE